MKVKQKNGKFRPIVITLETQEEVDGMFTLANYAGLTRAVGLLDMYEELEGYQTDGADNLFHMLEYFITNEGK